MLGNVQGSSSSQNTILIFIINADSDFTTPLLLSAKYSVESTLQTETATVNPKFKTVK